MAIGQSALHKLIRITNLYNEKEHYPTRLACKHGWRKSHSGPLLDMDYHKFIKQSNSWYKPKLSIQSIYTFDQN